MSDAAEGDPALFRLFNEIAIVEQLARSRLEQVLPGELRAPHFAVLNHLVRLGDDRAPARIARAFQVTKGTMTNTLQRLEAQGLVTLHADPEDGRGKRVRLTPEGRRARDAAVAAVQPLLADVGTVVSADELTAAVDLLGRIRSLLDRARD